MNTNGNELPKTLFRWGLLCTSILFFQPTWAQDNPAVDPDGTAELDKIEVTGSRLKRQGFETPSPVTVIEAAEIRQSGAITLGDLLNEMPQLRGTFTMANSGRFIGTAGVGRLDLRGLGSDRTLVLINGRRHVSGNEGGAQVDVNSIPTELIERIEVITGANSAVYGADAVTGTINIILKDNFTGSTFTAQSGDADDSGFGRSSASFTAGRDFDNGQGNAVVSFTYAQQDLLTAGDRGGNFTAQFGRVPNPLDGDTIDPVTGFQIDDGIPDFITVPNQGFWAISNAGTSLALNGLINDDGSFRPVPFGAFEFTDGLSCGGTGCTALDLDSFQPLQVGFERFTVDANMKYTVGDFSEFYIESRYSSVSSNQQGQPSFDFGVPILISRDNAFVSTSLGAAMDAAGASVIDLRRFNVDLGLRQERDTRETVRAVAGIRGSFGKAQKWEYDTFVNYGRTRVERQNLNNRIDERFAAAYDAVALSAADVAAIGGSGLIPNASVGQTVCRSTLQAATGQTPTLPNGAPAPDFAFDGCVPLNVLGFGLLSPEAADFVNSTALGTAQIDQFQAQAVVSTSELFNTWAGPVGFVGGVEFREEQSKAFEDSLSGLGNTFFNALSTTVGDFDVNEAFTEISLPLLRDVTGAQDLTLELAGRYSDYSTIGDTFTWESRLNWQPINSLRFRATFGEALRAPNIGDLFAPPGENFRIVADPCDMDNLADGRNGRVIRIANCQALGIADPETFDSLDEQSIPLRSGGNPDLNEEESETLTVGFVWSPGFIEGLSLSVDFWDIEITDAIANTGAQAILDRCVDDPNGINNQFCSLVTRAGNGNISELRQFPLNLNRLETSGFDFEADYTFDLNRFGVLRTRLLGSFLDERTFFLNSDDDVDIIEGELGDPEWEAALRLNWLAGNWDVFSEIRYIDSQYLVEQENLFGSASNNDPNPDSRDIIKASSQVYLDLGFNYNFSNGLSLGINVDNLTDEDPPFPLFGNGEGSAIYDNIGRYYNATLVWNF